jgi:hypothetical protein
MDDVLILAPTRWKLREAIRVLNQTFSELRLENHPDKTFIGRIEKGFDFLGYHFSPEGLSVAEKTIETFLARAVRLYEQELEEPCGSPSLDCMCGGGQRGCEESPLRTFAPVSIIGFASLCR